MPPAESKRENAIANVITTLAAFAEGSEYNYQTQQAIRVRTGAPFFDFLDPSLDMQYFVEVGRTIHAQESQPYQGAGVIWLSTVELFVIGAKRHKPDAAHPANMTQPDVSTIHNRIWADATHGLLTTTGRGGHARTTDITDDGPVDPAGIDELTGWAALEMRFEIQIEWDEVRP